MSLEENIKQWVRVDDQIKSINDKVKELKDQKNRLEDNIIVYVEKNNLDNATAKITGGKLKFVTTKQTSPLTLKYIEECLGKLISDKEQINQIMACIKDDREVKYTKDIKRYFDKE